MLATFRVHKDKNNPYVSIHKGFLSDKDLSWRSKGILAYLLSKPDDWVVRVEDIRVHAKEGDKAVRRSISELLKKQYLSQKILRNDEGKFFRFEYDVYESPSLNPGSPHSLVSHPFIQNGEMDNFMHNEAQSESLKKEIEAMGLTYTEDMREH